MRLSEEIKTAVLANDEINKTAELYKSLSRLKFDDF